ncbi:MAG: hypothetical protein Q7S57_04390 [bacterium]|nr:hypothetical protein [bacterium]
MFDKWRHKYLWLFLLGIIFAIFVVNSETTKGLLSQLAQYGYAGAFFGGVLYIFTFTTATGLVVITELGQTMNPFLVGIIGGAGAVFGDLLIFIFARKSLEKEIKTSLKKVGGNFLLRILESKPLKWFLPLIGAVIIASPFPDEIGVSLMGISRISMIRFFLLAYVLNTVGIFIIVLVGKVVF